MIERSKLIEWIRAELVGPARPLNAPSLIEFAAGTFVDPVRLRSGPLAWRPEPAADPEEILYFQRETPHRKYGAGALHPVGAIHVAVAAAQAGDTLGVELEGVDVFQPSSEETEAAAEHGEDIGEFADPSDDFEVTSADIRHPSTVGISFCLRLRAHGTLIVKLPGSRRFSWQQGDDQPFQLNGRYEPCIREWTDENGEVKEAPMWRRWCAIPPDTEIRIDGGQLVSGEVLRRDVTESGGSPIRLRLEIFPRSVPTQPGLWLLTVVLRNVSQPQQANERLEAILYQTFFEVSVIEGALEKYPESQRPFEHLDSEEQSLSLLYRESATWGVGHGCAAGWEAEGGRSPEVLFVDVLPAVETPSMTPDIRNENGNPIQLSMRALATLPKDGQGVAWKSLTDLAQEYKNWIEQKRLESSLLPTHLKVVAGRHLGAAESCLDRINKGIKAIQDDDRIWKAFCLANLAMLLQQIATKQLKKRSLIWQSADGLIRPFGEHVSPWHIFDRKLESTNLGAWRAFQIAFLLMSLPGVSGEDVGGDRDIVDLIWFPTGGGKTEAYLGVMAFYMFHQRLLTDGAETPLPRDGTNVLMRYTLRMLTTQQFQRAASLICAMEFLRRNPTLHGIAALPGRRFSLGLWVGGSGSPNKKAQAKAELSAFRSNRLAGNPLVLTECPWCKSEIGRYEGSKPRGVADKHWNARRVRGISDHTTEGPLLLCPDAKCVYGSEHWQDWLPIEVIDERIYDNPPSLIIGTADKFAMIAFKPEAGSLFGRTISNGEPRITNVPPGLIVQDELHLISGPLGTMYGLYESVFERLCSRRVGDGWFKPKIIASTATIRGAAEQVRALYARTQMQLFPSPGLVMGDSFFGTYARGSDGTLLPGRLYLGVHANDYGSVLTTQVRLFSSVLFRPQVFQPHQRDPWWSLLVFYNSIRELGGAKTLFDSDIRSRLKFVFNRENVVPQDRRTLRVVEELTSRLSQAEIVGMIDRLSTVYSDNDQALDVCLASNIIEVGVDIDRLSLMGVVGQPKTTAQYIQVTGRVGRRWWERPGLVLTIYNPSKSRDRSHFEQFHSYHRRLYERVEPTSATPFALSAIQRALPGALIAWSRQHSDADVRSYASYEKHLDSGLELLQERCQSVQLSQHQTRALRELERVCQDLRIKWRLNPQEWQEFPPSVNGEYLMLWPGQFATLSQKQRGVIVPSSMRQVDGSAELTITQAYLTDAPANND
jgi:hypothetical protein